MCAMALSSSSSPQSSLLLHLRSPEPSALHVDQHKFGFRSNQDTSILNRRTKSHALRMVMSPDICIKILYFNLTRFFFCTCCTLILMSQVSATKSSNKEVTMVDPLEAKRLAEKQMQEIKAKEKYKRKREIEAINGGWAVIGLTAGLVVEGHTGNGILKQLVSYWHVIPGSLFH
ncbi:unnamed protein product [Rhodiola kirilowii]